VKEYPAEYYDNKYLNRLIERKPTFEKILAKFDPKRTFESTVEGKPVLMRKYVWLGLTGLKLDDVAAILGID